MNQTGLSAGPRRSPLLRALVSLRRLFVTPYDPEPAFDGFLERARTKDNARARVTVAVLTAAESRRVFGTGPERRGVQPVWLEIENRSADGLRLQVVSLDPSYFTALEAAARCHHSALRRLSAYGILGWLFFPLLALLPSKLITAWTANRRMDDTFRSLGFRLAPIEPGRVARGFVFTSLDAGTKAVHVRLGTFGGIGRALERDASGGDPALDGDAADFHFTIPVPGIAADYLHRDFAAVCPPETVRDVSAAELVARLEALPATTTGARGTRGGDPVNLVVIGNFDTLLAAFVARWDESESITLATCWKTVKAFLLGSHYRYSPVSALHLFGRSQDIALQRARHTINERLHLRLWLVPLSFRGRAVWVGQVSRDIGVRLTTRAWNLTTHRIDPDVDESRDYCIEDLSQARRVEAAGYVGGVGPRSASDPGRNLTGDPWISDGRRAVILLAESRGGEAEVMPGR